MWKTFFMITFIQTYTISNYFRAAKEQKKATKAAKKATAPAPAKKQQQKQKAAKNVQKSAPRVGGRR